MSTSPKTYTQPEEDIRKARTLSADYYRNPDYFHSARELVFARSWQFIFDTDLLPSGGAVPITMLENYLDEPVLLTRDSSEQVHCMSNVCTHRGTILAEKPCQTTQLRCRYHGRRFGADGKFVSAPGFEDAIDFPGPEDNLPHVPTKYWSKFIFSSAKPAHEFDEVFGEMRDRISWMPLKDFVFRPDLSSDWETDANWALYVENYLEGLHVPFVHPGLATYLDVKNYHTEVYKHSTLQLGGASKAEESFHLPPESPDYGQKIGAYYFWVFPNMMFNFYPWGLSINVVVPLAPDRTRIKFLTYMWDESQMAGYTPSDIEQTEREDEAIVEQVQKGIRSRFYNNGRYAPRWETGTRHFHVLLEQALQGHPR